MITNYSVKIIDNEEVLCLYFDYTYEIGVFGSIKNFSLKEQITNYIKNRRIKFKGQKIGIIVAGILVAMISVSPLQVNNSSNKEFSYVNNILFNDVVINNDAKVEEVEEDVIEEDILEENIVVQGEKLNQSSEKTVTNNKIPSKNNSSSNNNSINNNSSSNNQNSNVSVNDPPPVQTETVSVQNKTMVNVQRSNGQILNIELEEYIIGVVGAEMPASFNIEALKSQAIISRTYALKRISENKVLTDTVSTQAYKDNNQLKAQWGSSYTTYYNKIKQAVESTEGLVITYNGSLIDAVYHSTSNGYTADAKTIWGYDIPYLKSVDSSWDKNVSSYLKTTTKDFNIVSNILGIDFNENTIIEVLSRDSSGRIRSIKVGDNNYSGTQFRNLFDLRSTDFDIVFTASGINIVTKGYGHGAGLSQYGASEMAKLGYSYNQILKHYYTGVNIVKK